MWELLAGSILAYYEITKGYRSENKTLNLILPFTGLILIGHSILFFNDNMFHPSFYTLSPIIGVCLIIWFSSKNELITKILSTKLFVGVGLISYSLYLWHYPIFTFIKITGLVMGNMTHKLLLIPILLICCSVISYHFVEKPFRNKENNIKYILILIVISSLVLIFCNFYVINNNGLKNRHPEFFLQDLKKKIVNFHQKDNTQKIVFIGDSHAEALEFNLNEEIKKKDLSLIKFRTRMYLTDFNYVYKKTKKIDENFINTNIKIDNFLRENSNLIVVFHHRWTLRILETFFDNEEGFKEKTNHLIGGYHSYLEPINIKTSSLKERQQYIKEGLISQINKIINQGHKLILVYPVPEVGVNPYRYLWRKYNSNKNLFNNSIPIFSSSYDVYKKRNKLIFKILNSIKNENIYRVYPHSYFCDKQIENRCVANDKNNIFYYDDDHLSIQGSKLVVDEIMKEIEKIELKSN
jgi:hypothetical protein